MPAATDHTTANIDRMRRSQEGMDIVIVSTSSERQAEYWQARLEAGRGDVTRADAIVLAVHEDWPGGAGNGLGTLYALRQAEAKARALHGVELLDALRDGAAVALYHTAGKGTRLAPLPGSETNNKPGVKLPGMVTLGHQSALITILEAVIRQTSIYATSRAGRLSVFWGDQVFVPVCDPDYIPRHHADILCRLDTMPDRVTWGARGMHTYGLIAVGADGDAVQVEKVDHELVTRLVERGYLSVDGGIGVSLGSFSLSTPLVEVLLDEFAEELAARHGKLDTDPHFWMPMTLPAEVYAAIMATKGVDPEEAARHHARMAEMRDRLLADAPLQGLFGAVDIGRGALWWDYGKLPDYLANNLRLIGSTPEARAMRRFYGINNRRAGSRLGAVEVDADSIVVGSRIAGGRIARSVLIGVDAEAVDVTNSLALAVATPRLGLHGALAYNVAEPRSLVLDEEQVRADVWLTREDHQVYCTKTSRDGGRDWDATLPGNFHSYARLAELNAPVDPALAAEHAAAARRAIQDPHAL